MRRRTFFLWGVWSLAALEALGGGITGALGRGAQKAGLPAAGWRVLEPVTYENLSLFPVTAQQGADTSVFLTLDEALASGEAVVTESGGEILRRTRDGRPLSIPGGVPQVNQLVLVNRSAKPLVLLAGEVLSGGKQDRIIAKDRIVPPGATPLPLDVFCVEHGRWSGGATQFAGSKLIVHPSVREKAVVEQKQDEVWAAVRSGTTHRAAGGQATAPAALSGRALDAVVAAEAPSQSYAKIYTSARVGPTVESFAEEVARRFARATAGLKGERVVGVLVAYGGEVAWADVFASPALFDRYWSKLLRSYAVEALARPQERERATLGDAREFLEPLVGRESVESEPGVYRWRQVTQGRYAEIALEALAPRAVTLHWVKIHRTS